MDAQWLDRISQVPPRQAPSSRAETRSSTADVSFAAALQSATAATSPPSSAVPAQTLQFSAHAKTRMMARGLALSPADHVRLGQAVGAAAQKGARDTYISFGDIGFVVHVPNRTVVTAMTHQEQTIVTNVDSIVVVPRPDRNGSRGAGTD